jgi:hypothetical protein
MPTRKSRQLWTFWVLFAFIFLALGCGSSITEEPTSRPTSAEDNPTAGAIVRSTREAKATLSSQATAAQKTALAETATQLAANLIATAEIEASATAEAIAAATAQGIAIEQASWPVLLTEAFQDNQLGWPLNTKQDRSLTVHSAIADGSYQWTVTVRNGNSYFNLIPEKSPILDGFYAGVTIQFSKGNQDGQSAYGLTFRHVENDYGFFGIEKSGQFRILEVHGTGIYQLYESNSPAIDRQPGHTNRIGVAAIGPVFVFLINDQVVGHLSAEIDPGQVGLGIDALSNASQAQVIFTDFELRAPQK